ncbi:MAG: zinc ribbon domain-containing protein [Deltaproteobacteria bacterium]|nr:MAG: zinc ribbon domain-containing protein [Deltaproteobacteria bacterium]
MPTYSYSCPNCGQFEWQQAISEAALTECPRCGAAVQRVITATGGFIMKGRGPAADCDRETPCCGRETRCDRPPCRK